MKSALRLAMLALMLCLPAHAHEVQTGVIMICDTQKQVERFVSVFDGNAQTAIGAVNAAENDPTACAMMTVAYVRGPEIAIARTRSDAFSIVPVIVVAINGPAGMRSVPPAPFYTLIKVKEFAV